MASSHDHEPHLSSEEKDFVKWCAEHYAPPAMTVSKQVVFDQALATRVSRRKVRGFRPLAVAAAVAGVFGLWLTFQVPIDSERTNQKERLGSRGAVGPILFGFTVDELDRLEDESLPEDYLVLSQLLSPSGEDR